MERTKLKRLTEEKRREIEQAKKKLERISELKQRPSEAATVAIPLTANLSELFTTSFTKDFD